MIRLICGCVLLVGSLGCESMSHTGKGVVGGSLLGSAVGTGIGLATGNPQAGAAIGGLGGAAVGGMVGAHRDERQRERDDAIMLAQAQAEAGATSRGPLSVAEVMQMVQPDATGRAVSDEVIIGYIRSTGSQYNLSPQDLRDLTAAGVSDRVVQEMMATRQRVPTQVIRQPRTVVVREPYYDPYYAPPVILAGPWGPPPPPAFGFTYVRRR